MTLISGSVPDGLNSTLPRPASFFSASATAELIAPLLLISTFLARRTLIIICGNFCIPVFNSAKVFPLSEMARITCSAATIPSPVVFKSLQSTCPEPSPPKLQPFSLSASTTYRSPTLVRRKGMPKSLRANSIPKLLMRVPATPLQPTADW